VLSLIITKIRDVGNKDLIDISNIQLLQLNEVPFVSPTRGRGIKSCGETAQEAGITREEPCNEIRHHGPLGCNTKKYDARAGTRPVPTGGWVITIVLDCGIVTM